MGLGGAGLEVRVRLGGAGGMGWRVMRQGSGLDAEATGGRDAVEEDAVATAKSAMLELLFRGGMLGGGGPSLGDPKA